MTAPEPAVLAALQGRADHAADRWPAPRAVKIFIASPYNEYREERRQLLELVGPELQTTYDDRNIEVELVDMHYGEDGGDEGNPALLRHRLADIRHAATVSKAGFFLILLGSAENATPVLPQRFPAELHARLSDADAAVAALYRPDELSEADAAKDSASGDFVLQDEEQWYSCIYSREEERRQLAEAQAAVTSCVLAAARDATGSRRDRLASLLRSAHEAHADFALGLGRTGEVVAALRPTPASPPPDAPLATRLAHERLAALRSRLFRVLPERNVVTLTESLPSNARVEEEPEAAEERLSGFRERILGVLGELIDQSLSTEPDQGKGRKKTVPELLSEHMTHMRMCDEHSAAHALTSEPLRALAADVLERMRRAHADRAKHAPLLLVGAESSGKTTLLTHIYNECAHAFAEPPLRVVRFAGATPRSAYSLELLRVLCQQLSVALHIPEGYLPKDASFEPLYINNWLQSLLRRCAERSTPLVLLVDDVHRLSPLDCDVVTGLSWLPLSLPHNVFLVCSSAAPLDRLQLTPAHRDKFLTAGCVRELPEQAEHATSHALAIDATFDRLERSFGASAFGRLAGYLTCSEFGLSETELLELLMPTTNSRALVELRADNFTFSTLCVARAMLGDLLLEKTVSGRAVACWRAAGAAARARRRYVRAQTTLRDAHSDLAALHFAHFLRESPDDDSDSEPREPGEGSDAADSTPFHSSARAAAAAVTQRHVEEAWLHLLLAGDFAKLKELTVANFDFLLAAVQTVSVSYLRCVLEHVRCYILDRDVELVCGAVRKSSDILTRDPMQLGAQIIAWLRPAVTRRDALAALVTAAMAWCDGYDKPLLVPLNGWLQPPIASTVRVLTVGGAGWTGGIQLVQLAPSGQHVVLTPAQGDPQLWHLMSNSRVHTFKGHTGRVLCICVGSDSQFLITGSEDTAIIVWDLHTLTLKLKIQQHIAPVLCVAALVCRGVVVSGGEDSAVIVSSLADGTLVTKLDHHRGPVTGVQSLQSGEVVATCSTDGTVCTWRTDAWTALSTVCAARSPLRTMRVTDDHVFLVTLQDDNELHLRTLVTGTHLHTLKRHKAKVKCFWLAHDSCRAAVGCADQRIYIYSLLSGQLLRTLPAAHDLSALAGTEHDHFLLAAGGNRVTVYSFHTEDNITNFRPTKQTKQRPTTSTTSLSLLEAEQSSLIPINCLALSRDSQLCASGCARGLVRVWQLSTHRLHATLNAHVGSVTCVAFAPNSLLVLSGSEDRSVVVWLIADNSPSRTYKGHTAALQSLAVMADSRRAVSGDRARAVHVWLVDSGIVLHSSSDTPSATVALTHNMKFAVFSDGDNTVKIWAIGADTGEGGEERRSVAHAERVTCFALTADSLHLVTGSEDMSLKVWQLSGGKLSQVLVGHSDVVSCVAVSVSCKTQVVSGAWDSNLIVWDINTGAELHLLCGHLAKVTCVQVTGDGTIAISGSEDRTLIVWETKRGLALTSLALHVPLLGIHITGDCSRIVVHLLDRGCLPIVCLHNTPATYVKIPTYAAPKEFDELRPLAPKRPMRRLLKKEVSLDTYTWQKKYGHLTSSAMMAQVDERLKRRFSVSASMEEISKIQQEKNKELGSQASLGPEQAALAQSQHFDQLEALWNKISPPRRRAGRIAKQSSLVERLDSSDDERTPPDEQEHMLE